MVDAIGVGPKFHRYVVVEKKCHSSNLCKLVWVCHVYSSPLWHGMDAMCWPTMHVIISLMDQQSRNVPLVFRTLGLQHILGVGDHILIM